MDENNAVFLPLIPENQDIRPETIVLQPKPGIGDMIWQLPTLQALARDDPTGCVDLIADGRVPVRTLLGNEGIINQVLPLEAQKNLATRIGATLRLVRLLRPRQYKRLYILHHSSRYALAGRLAGIRNIYGWGLGVQRFMLSQPSTLMPSSYKSPVFPLYLGRTLLDRLGIPHDNDLPHLHTDSAAVGRITAAYKAIPKPWVAFGIGSTESRRIWPAERFAAIADQLHLAGYSSFLLGVPHEHLLAERIAAACGIAKPTIVTDRPLNETMALIAQCSFSFCNDSGLMNITAALGIPTHVLFSTPYHFVYSPLIRPIFPEGQPVNFDGAHSISVDLALAKLREEGIVS